MNPAEVLAAELARQTAENDTLNALFDRAKAHAHACGLFQGGHVMETPFAVVDRLDYLEKQLDAAEAEVARQIARAERAEMDADRLARALGFELEAHNCTDRGSTLALNLHAEAVALRGTT